MNRAEIVIRYSAFAIVAVLVNLAVQRITLSVSYGERQLFIAIAFGTIAGLLVKYFLDKRWIFAAVRLQAKQKGIQFVLYVATGVVTTLIFWGAEYVAWRIYETDLARECGAIAGLVIGYVCKYQLDRKYVFNQP